MKASNVATRDLNHLRRGTTYRATTPDGAATGEYLGMETSHGDRAILLRRRSGTTAVELATVTSIRPIAA